MQASGNSANKKGYIYKFGFLYHFYELKGMRFPFKCKDTLTLFKTKSDDIDTPFNTENPEKHTLSGCTSPLRPYMGVPPRNHFIR